MSLKTLTSPSGFGFIDLVIAVAVVMGFFTVVLAVKANEQVLIDQARARATFDRIVSGVRTMAGNPAALRNSMRAAASDGVTPVNPALAACAGGTPANACNGQTDYGFTLYAPLITNGAAGLLIQPVTSASGAANPVHFDIWGNACASASATCPLVIYTSMRAQCAPATQDATASAVGSLTPAMLDPQPSCTIAEIINVTYTIQLDPTVTATGALAAFAVPVTGFVATPVVLISGNLPQ